MTELIFNASDFKKSILETIQPEIQAVQDAIKNKADIASKEEEFNQKIKDLTFEAGKLCPTKSDGAKALMKMDYETHKSNQKKLADINDEINILKQYIITLGVESEKCKQAFDPTRTELIKAVREAAQAYIDNARIPIFEVIEAFLKNNNEYKKAILEIVEQVGQENELRPLGFNGESVPLNLYPLPGHIARMESFLAEYKNAVS